MNWQTPETAPKDTTFMADVGLPFAVVACWNAAEDLWVYANAQCDLYRGAWNDFYFENERTSELLGWMPMPEVER